jgi:hypothetical protein
MYKSDDKPLRTKRCPKCGETKDETQWVFKDKEHKCFSSYCKQCDNVRKKLSARERFKDPERRKKENHRQRLWKYGINEKIFTSLMERAQGKCEICGDPSELVIDHCHTSKEVRGILCWSCNVALGHFKDSEEKIKKAFEYLCKFNQSS